MPRGSVPRITRASAGHTIEQTFLAGEATRVTNFFGSGPLPDWREIREWLGKDIPWHLVEKWDSMQDGDWVDRLVGRLAAERGESHRPPADDAYLRFDTVKQANKLIVAVQLPPQTRLQILRLYAAVDRLRVAGLPGGRSQSVRLPCRVYPKSGKTALEGRRLRVEFRRRPAEQEEVELFIPP